MPWPGGQRRAGTARSAVAPSPELPPLIDVPAIQKEAPMKARILIFLVVVSLLLVITPAVSQVIEAKWTANVPFDFVVGETQMPAGEYMVKSNPHTMRLTVINKETRQKASVLTRDIENLKPNEKTVLIFQQDGDRHVLHQIWGESEGHGHDVVHGSDVIELMKMK